MTDIRSEQVGAGLSLPMAAAPGGHQPPRPPPARHPVHEPHPRRPPGAHRVDGVRDAVGDGDLRGRDPLQGERHRQPPGRPLRARRAEHAGDQGGRPDGEEVPEPDGVREAPPGRRQRRDGVRDLHGQHHQLRQGRGAAAVQEHHRVRAGQRRGGGQAAQQHAEQGRGDEPVQQAPRRAAAGQGPLPDEVEQVAGQLLSEVPEEPLGVHIPRRRRRPARGHPLADCVYRFAFLL
uniref:Uncharacterized protein n=1 Tax=Triticum urartu TaxID=4572 RepID=A0A8R7V5H2_TRIUA